jgi:hypothetical protein
VSTYLLIHGAWQGAWRSVWASGNDYGGVRGPNSRYYIEFLRDRAITLKLQQGMQKYSPCQQTFSIDTDHSPFFSAPEQLASILLQIGSS